MTYAVGARQHLGLAARSFLEPWLVATMRWLAFVLLIAPITATARVPVWVAWTVAEASLGAVEHNPTRRNAIYIGVLVVAGSICVMKFVAPMLAVIPWPDSIRASVGFAAVWILAVLASCIVVVGGAPVHLLLALTHQGGLALLWFLVEMIATAGPAALIATLHRSPAPPAPAAFSPHVHTEVAPVPSAPSAVTSDDVLERLHKIARREQKNSLAHPQPDGSILTSHRSLAEVFKIPRTNIVRRLKALERAGEIKSVSDLSGTRIYVLGPPPNTGDVDLQRTGSGTDRDVADT